MFVNRQLRLQDVVRLGHLFPQRPSWRRLVNVGTNDREVNEGSTNRNFRRRVPMDTRFRLIQRGRRCAYPCAFCDGHICRASERWIDAHHCISTISSPHQQRISEVTESKILTRRTIHSTLVKHLRQPWFSSVSHPWSRRHRIFHVYWWS